MTSFWSIGSRSSASPVSARSCCAVSWKMRGSGAGAAAVTVSPWICTAVGVMRMFATSTSWSPTRFSARVTGAIPAKVTASW